VSGFVRKKPSLAIEPSGVPAERPVRADGTVARHDDGSGVQATRVADGSESSRTVDPSCELGIGNRVTGRHSLKLLPDDSLEFRASTFDGKIRNSANVAIEITFDFVGDI
jgi:hypothetical protein